MREHGARPCAAAPRCPGHTAQRKGVNYYLNSPDAETLEAEAIKAESDAQKAYETYVKDTNKSIEEKTRDITNKTEEKATADGDKVAAEEADRKSVV